MQLTATPAPRSGYSSPRALRAARVAGRPALPATEESYSTATHATTFYSRLVAKRRRHHFTIPVVTGVQYSPNAWLPTPYHAKAVLVTASPYLYY